MIRTHVLVLILTTLLAPPALAQWHHASGQAQIIKGDIDDARRRATERAISHILLQSGGTFDYQKKSHNGVLTDEHLSVTAQAQIEQTELLKESRSGDILTINLRARLMPKFDGQCVTAAGRMAVSIPKAFIRHREQLVPGGLFDFDDALTRFIRNTLDGEGRFAFSNNQALVRFDNQGPETHWVRSLAEKDHSQFVLAVSVDDISLRQPKRLLGYMHRTGARQIAWNATLYDAFSQQAVWQQRYHGQGAWPYKPQEQANTASERFWSSDFGQEIQRLGLQMVNDINTELACQPLKGRILKLEQDRVILDIGKQNGLKKGEVLQVVQQQEQWGSPGELSITLEEVQQQRALAKLNNPAALLGVQVGDWVQRESK